MNREEIQNKLIEDLQDIAPKMSSTTTTTVERDVYKRQLFPNLI